MPRLILLLFPMLALSQATQPDARELLLHSADAIKKYSSYQIHSLSLIETHGGMNNRMQMPAVISVRRPDLMRIESHNEAASMTVVSDGAHTFVYLDSQKKYIKRAATSSPESALAENGVLKNLPDITKFIQTVEITGDSSMDIDNKSYEYWIVETHYDTIKLPELTISRAVQVSWISKALGITLQNSFTALLEIASLAEPVQITQATTTMGLSLDVDLPDSLFVFTPPAGAVETADWTLPGITKPDLEGKPAPVIKGAPPTKGKVVLVNFWTDWSAPSKKQLPILEKLSRQFRAQGFVLVNINAGNLSDDDDILKALSVNAYPTSVLIDRTGKIVSYQVGAQSEASLRGALGKLGIKPVPVKEAPKK